MRTVLEGAEPHLEKRRVRDRAVPWKMSMAMLSRPSWPSLLFRKFTSVTARLALLLISSVFAALVGLPGSTCEIRGGQIGPICLELPYRWHLE